MVKRTLVLVFFVSALFFSPFVHARVGDPEVSGRESKILLKADKFSQLHEGLGKFWILVKKVAVDQGFKVNEPSVFPGEERTRYLVYKDSTDFNIFRKGFILRQRQNKPDFGPSNRAHKKRAPKVEITLKFRTTEIPREEVQFVKPAPGLDAATSIEEDVVAGPVETKQMYSLATQVKCKREPGSTLEDYAGIFPGLPRLGIPPHTRISRVNNVVVREYSIKPGYIQLDARIPAEVTFSVWYLNQETKPSIIEFSYKYKVVPKGHLNGNLYRSSEAADRLLKGIQRAGADWIADGQTKTGLIYKLENPDQE